MTPEQLADFMRSAGFVSLVKYERVHPSFNRRATWGHRAVDVYMEIYIEEGNIFINRLFTPKRFRWMGFATRALNMLCEQADKDHITLRLLPYNWLGADPFDLVAWYKRFGFVSHANDRYAMERKPQ